LSKKISDEHFRRIWAATQDPISSLWGFSIVAGATRLSPNTIKKGIKEIEELESKEFDKERIRKEGGSRKSILESILKSTQFLIHW
jgi:hypothetical protein